MIEILKLNRKKKKKKRGLEDLILVIAVGLLMTPFGLSWYSDYLDQQIVQKVEPAMTKVEQKSYNEQLKDTFAAHDENIPDISEAPEIILNPTISPIGTIDIPKIEEKIPLYMNITEEGLALGAAILNNTSYPTSEPDANSVITGHRGTPNKTIFRNLDKLNVGDFVYINLDEPEILRYKVRSSEVVEPHETDKFKLEEGKSMITLVTCTPYLINSHRILTYCDFDKKIPNPAYVKDEEKRVELEEIVKVVSEGKEATVDTLSDQNAVSNGFGQSLIDKIRLMNPVRLAIAIFMIGAFFRWAFGMFIQSEEGIIILNNVFKMISLPFITGIIFYVCHSGFILASFS